MTNHSWFRDYCETTTSYCMRYFVMKRSPIEKLFWMLTFSCMLTITVFALRSIINVWINNPTVMFIENTESAIREIPFPSFTICPANQIRKWVWEKYKTTNTPDWENLKHYEGIACSSYMPLQNYEYKQNFNYESIKSMVNKCGISCSEVFQSDIKWQNTTLHNICQYVQPTLTLLGLCYTINMLPTYQIFNDKYYKRYMDFFSKNNTFLNTQRSNWNLDDGYSLYLGNNILTEVIPARTGGTSYYHRLRLMLHVLDDQFLECPSRINNNIVIMINNPTEYYAFRSRSLIVPDTYSKIQITPFVKKINKNLMWRSPEIRKCYLHNERNLTVFKQYSESNCHNECIINQTISMCGCIHFEMSFLVASTDIEICGPSEAICKIKAIQETYKPNIQILCNCLPTCTVIEYEVIHTSHYDDWTYMKATNLTKNNSRGATVEITFKHPYFIAYKSASILNFYSLISTIGGMLSLLLGMNIINIFELLYVIIQKIYNYTHNMFDNH